MKTALIVTTYNRPEYLKRCLDSLIPLIEQPDILVIVDDASNNKETINLIANFTKSFPNLFQCIFFKENGGIKSSLRAGVQSAYSLGAELFINLDGDAIVKPNFITELKQLHTDFGGEYIISGFNSLNKNADGTLRNPILSEGGTHIKKKHANGINMCFDIRQYDSIIWKALQSKGNWDFDAKQEQGFIIAKPSLVQHIGINSSMGHNENPDVAADFYELELPSVGLFCIDAHDPEGMMRAAEICQRGIKFGSVKTISERLFSGREAYSNFMVKDLWHHVKDMEGTHILTFHPDGYVQCPSAWDDEWLNTDFLGATWWYKDGMNSGNGGFSLRSKKLIEILSQLDLTGLDVHPEDNFICRQLRPWLEKEYGIKFGTEEQCNRFSIEAYNVPPPDNRYSGQFGFHGYHVSGLPIPMPPKNVSKVPISVINRVAKGRIR